MRIAISSKGKTLESPVDQQFGRAQFFIIFETDDGRFEVIDNVQNINAAQGAGVQAAEMVAKKKPDIVIAGNFGPKAFRGLSAAGIKTALWADGTVSEAIELARNNKLNLIDKANVEGHWR